MKNSGLVLLHLHQRDVETLNWGHWVETCATFWNYVSHPPGKEPSGVFVNVRWQLSGGGGTNFEIPDQEWSLLSYTRPLIFLLDGKLGPSNVFRMDGASSLGKLTAPLSQRPPTVKTGPLMGIKKERGENSWEYSVSIGNDFNRIIKHFILPRPRWHNRRRKLFCKSYWVQWQIDSLGNYF